MKTVDKQRWACPWLLAYPRSQEPWPERQVHRLIRGRVPQDLALGTAGPSQIRENLGDVNARPQDEHSLWELGMENRSSES